MLQLKGPTPTPNTKILSAEEERKERAAVRRAQFMAQETQSQTSSLHPVKVNDKMIGFAFIVIHPGGSLKASTCMRLTQETPIDDAISTTHQYAYEISSQNSTILCGVRVKLQLTFGQYVLKFLQGHWHQLLTGPEYTSNPVSKCIHVRIAVIRRSFCCNVEFSLIMWVI